MIPMQDVLDWLQAHREDSLTPAQITKQYGYECAEGSQLHKTLLANNKIGVSADGSLTYKARICKAPASQVAQQWCSDCNARAAAPCLQSPLAKFLVNLCMLSEGITGT